MTGIAVVVAHARNCVIGRNNAMPWHLPADLRHFRELTWGHPILMGRGTHEAIGRVLPGRRTLVLTRQAGLEIAGCECVQSLAQGIEACAGAPWLFVIGGAAVYQIALPHAMRLHVTEIHADIEGDTLFPPLDLAAWRELDRVERPADATNAHALSFVTLERANAPHRLPR